MDTIHLALITLFLCSIACLRLLCSISRDLGFSAFYTQKRISLCMSSEMSLNVLPISCFNSVYTVVYDDRVYNMPLRCQSEKLSLLKQFWESSSPMLISRKIQTQGQVLPTTFWLQGDRKHHDWYLVLAMTVGCTVHHDTISGHCLPVRHRSILRATKLSPWLVNTTPPEAANDLITAKEAIPLLGAEFLGVYRLLILD